MHNYFAILKSLTQNRVPYLAIGTWALKLAYPKIMAAYQLSDCDVLIKNDLQQIRHCIRVLKKEHWQVRVWEEAIDENVEADFLKGKYYLRAQKEGLTLDLTYECPLFSWQELEEEQVERNGFYLGNLEHVLALKKAKGREKDLETVRLFNGIASSYDHSGKLRRFANGHTI